MNKNLVRCFSLLYGADRDMCVSSRQSDFWLGIWNYLNYYKVLT